ncbi:MAG TPA: hypothetical protein VMX12_10830 [Acidimicrobiia bacterium]|nr:hypothetical protein [Acidimicrobiia bacterium]
MRFLRQLKLLVAENDDGTGRVSFDDGGSLVRTETAATFASLVNDGTLSVAASGTKPIPFGDVTTAYAVLIQSDRELDLTFNGGAEVLKLRAPDQAASPSQRGVLYWEGSFTGVQVVNADPANAANVLYAVIGV